MRIVKQVKKAVLSESEKRRLVNMADKAFSHLSDASYIFHQMEQEINDENREFINSIKNIHSQLYDDVIVNLSSILERVDPTT